MFRASTPSARTRPAIPALADPTMQEWFNTAAFSAPTGCFGDAPRNSVIGPGAFTINSGLSKTIPIRARRPAAPRFQLEHNQPAQPRELFRAVHGAGFLHIRTNHRSGAMRSMQFTDAGELLMRTQSPLSRDASSLFSPLLPCSLRPCIRQNAAGASVSAAASRRRSIRARGPRRRPHRLPRGKATIRSTVSLVEIDVQVTDRDGKPVKGLKQEQFSVTEDGKPQKVSTFEYNDIEKIETAGESRRSAHHRSRLGALTTPEEVKAVVHDHRMIVLFFDMTSLQPEDLLRSTRAAREISPRANDAGRPGGSRGFRQHAESDREFHE